MDTESKAQTGARAARVWRKSRGWVARLSLTVRIMFGLFVFAALLVAMHTALSAKDASLHLTVQHSFRNADISLWVDGDLAYSGKLVGSAKKKFGLLAGSAQGNLSEIVALHAGVHRVRVQIQPEGGSAQQNTATADFAPNTERKLSVSTRPSGLSMAWQGTTTAAPSSSPSWFGHYASTLLLTLGGSIVSAITGFALRELPGHIRAQQAEVEEAKAQSTAAGL
jgi:hypothetical protein